MTQTLHGLLGRDLAQANLFTDYDGTLAAVVHDPQLASPTPGVVAALVALGANGCRVTVLSGRPIEFLLQMLGEAALGLIGQYGLEELVNGDVVVDTEAAKWEASIAEAAQFSMANGPAGMAVEHKMLSLTLHYRGRAHLAESVRNWAEAEAARTGLLARAARCSMELHSPVAIDKGVALLAHVDQSASSVIFIGDDVGDLPAFDALDQIEGNGTRVLRVGVVSPEMPLELRDRADVVLDGTDAVLRFLTRV